MLLSCSGWLLGCSGLKALWVISHEGQHWASYITHSNPPPRRVIHGTGGLKTDRVGSSLHCNRLDTHSTALCRWISTDLHALNLKLTGKPTFRALHTAEKILLLFMGLKCSYPFNCFCRGSFSEVYLVRERKTGNFYALKCVKKKQLHHSNLENEIKVLKRYKKKTQTSSTDTTDH